MSERMQCPNAACGRWSTIPADYREYAGHVLKCPSCHTKFTHATANELPSAALTHLGEPQSAHYYPSLVADGPKSETPERIGRFRVRAILGTGASGSVYRAFDPELEREIALKVPHAATLDSPQRVERFLREAKLAAKLQHPNIVPIYDAGSDGKFHFIASAFIEGKTLSQVLDAGPLDFRRAAQIVRLLADALAYSHERGIVHRDVKPANVMIDANGQPHLMDFGLAHQDDLLTRLTHMGAVLGTPQYMAPEQARGQSSRPRPASDQYSLGVLLYQLLCGRYPFTGPPAIVLFHTLNTEPKPLRRLNSAVPVELETICLRAMAKRPERRFADCGEMAKALDAWLNTIAQKQQDTRHNKNPIERIIRVPKPGSGNVGTMGYRKKTVQAAAAIVAFVILVVAVIVYGSRSPSASRGSQDKETEFAAVVQSGQQALKDKRFDVALSAFGQALKIRADDPIAQGGLEVAQRRRASQLIEQARELFSEREFAKAQKKLAEAWELDNTATGLDSLQKEVTVALERDRLRQSMIADHDAAMNWAEAAMKAADSKPSVEAYQKALVDYDRARKVLGELRASFVDEADVSKRDERTEKARAKAVDALAMAYNQRGNYAFADHDSAIADLSKAIALKPGFADAIKNLVRVYGNRGLNWFTKKDYKKAIADYEQALNHDPNYIPALLRRGDAFRKIRQHASAIDDYTRAIALGATGNVYSVRAATHLDIKNLSNAITDCDTAIRVNESDWLAFAIRGAAYGRQGDDKRAIDDLNKAIALKPNDAWTYLQRGNVWHDKKRNYDEAIRDYDEAIRCDPKYYWAFANRGMAYLNKNDYDKAIQDCDTAIGLDPKHGFDFGIRGTAYHRKGNHKKALDDLNQSIDLNPLDPWVFEQRSSVHSALLDAKSAAADAQKAKELRANMK